MGEQERFLKEQTQYLKEKAKKEEAEKKAIKPLRLDGCPTMWYSGFCIELGKTEYTYRKMVIFIVTALSWAAAGFLALPDLNKIWCMAIIVAVVRFFMGPDSKEEAERPPVHHIAPNPNWARLADFPEVAREIRHEIVDTGITDDTDDDMRPQVFQRDSSKLPAEYRYHRVSVINEQYEEIFSQQYIISLSLAAELRPLAHKSGSDYATTRERLVKSIRNIAGINIDRTLGLSEDDIFINTVDYVMALIKEREDRVPTVLKVGMGN